jgi:hypothetical protein
VLEDYELPLRVSLAMGVLGGMMVIKFQVLLILFGMPAVERMVEDMGYIIIQQQEMGVLEQFVLFGVRIDHSHQQTLGINNEIIYTNS